jgi:hypothetical protein
MPLMETAHRIAEALVTPSLESLAARLRTAQCEVCGRDFIESHRGGYRQKWCSQRCEWTGRQRRREQVRRDDMTERSTFWMNQTKRKQAAIDEMCWTCEPSGTCKVPTCALRSESPHPLVTSGSVPVAAVGRIVRPDTPERAAYRRARHAAAERRRKGKEQAA